MPKNYWKLFAILRSGSERGNRCTCMYSMLGVSKHLQTVLLHFASQLFFHEWFTVESHAPGDIFWIRDDDVIKRKHFPRYWPFVRGIHRSPVNSPHKSQWSGVLMFTLICARIDGWVNNREAGDLRRHRAHYDVIVMRDDRDHPVWSGTSKAWYYDAHLINTLRPRQNGRLFADDTLKRIFLNENIRISITFSQKFVPKGPINNIPALVQIMTWRRSGGKPLSEPMMVSLLTHICVTRPQWVNMV